MTTILIVDDEPGVRDLLRDALEVAEAVLAEESFRGVLYARVDLVMTPQGWAVMELEMVEPWLFLAYDDRAPRRLAEAIRTRLE